MAVVNIERLLSKEAIEAASEALCDNGESCTEWAEHDDTEKDMIRDDVRAALQAAVNHALGR